MKSDTELKKAIADNLVWATGHKSQNPNLPSAKKEPGKEHGSPFLFNIIVNERLEDGQYQFNVIYFDSIFNHDVGGGKRIAEIFSGISPKPIKGGLFPTYRRINPDYFVPVSKEEMEFFKTSDLFKKVVERWIDHNSTAPGNEKFYNYYKEELENLSDEKNAQICKNALEARERKKREEERKAVLYAKAKELVAYIKEKYPEVDGATWYDEYYVPGRQPHDDDYEGHGRLPIENMLVAIGIDSEEKVDKWLGDKDTRHLKMIVDSDKYHIRTYYGFAFKKSN